LARVPSKDTKTVINALIKQAHKLPRLATWIKREHQRTLETVLAERNGLVERSSESTECCCKTTQRTTARNVTI
jgi:hypothetical protein